jgi:hypothetical protein
MNISAEFAQALIKATSEIEGAVKDSTNPHYRSKYADLSSVIQAIKAPLNNNGITFLQKISDNPQAAYIETILIYKSGESLSLGTVAITPDKQTPQGMGSAITYARRYGLATALGVPAHDDDGNEASGIKSSLKKGPDFFFYDCPNLTKEALDYLVKAGATKHGEGLYSCSYELPRLARYRIDAQLWTAKIAIPLEEKK